MAITINGSGTVTGITAGGLPDGVITTDDLAANAVTTAKLGTDEASGLCKAWVNFNGTGAVAIRASYNVSSITDRGAGNYDVNFTAAMTDKEFAVAATAGEVDRIATNTKINDTISKADVRTTNLVGTYTDVSSISVAIFR